MESNKEWAEMVGNVGRDQYKKRIQFLKDKGMDTTAIEKTVKNTVESFNYGDNVSFVVFGEPQSGKTEMMIALNAKLLDSGCEVIVNLMNDSVDLLQQNLSRFREAGLSPSPKQFSELPSNPKRIADKQWLVFSKKNARDLENLSESLRFVKKLVIIDDEADYASPNSKVNKQQRTRINELIHNLLGNRGQYIGVTATPARLDLNNTFDNNTERWVDFDPHPMYVGQDFFFPQDGIINYRLHQFDADEGNERLELRNAVFHFLCGVAEQHKIGNRENFTMLVHTSGKTSEHREDAEAVEETLQTLSNPENSNFNIYIKSLLKIANEYSNEDPKFIVKFILNNINNSFLVKINSKRKNTNISDILSPKSLFSFGVGGNIISRGVTFDNLLCMYFTRTVKGKFTQDTYIQRARMFGNRSKFKTYFQLWITRSLMSNWTKCFVFHQLAIQAARSGVGAPVWLSDFKSTPTSSASIDRSSVDITGGAMSFGIFDLQSIQYMGDSHHTDIERLEKLKNSLPDKCFPRYIYDYLFSQCKKGEEICFHPISVFGTDKSNYTKEEIDSIRRKKSVFSTGRGDRPNAKHHLKIFKNLNDKARLYYSINGQTIRFIQNRR